MARCGLNLGTVQAPKGFVAAGGAEKQTAAFLRAARTLLQQSKKGRLKRSRLESGLCDVLGLSQPKVAKRLQKRIDANKLVQNQQWITMR